MRTIKTYKADPNKSEDIYQPGECDVLFGRGGGSNNHAGNIRFRKLVGEYKSKYFKASKTDKPKVAREVVKIWRNQSPPGRFLMKSPNSTESKTAWNEVTEKKAQEKTSQCLREKYAYFSANKPIQSSTDTTADLAATASAVGIVPFFLNSNKESLTQKREEYVSQSPMLEMQQSMMPHSTLSLQKLFPEVGCVSPLFQEDLSKLKETNIEIQKVLQSMMLPEQSREQYNMNLQLIRTLQQKQFQLLKKLYPHANIENVSTMT